MKEKLNRFGIQNNALCYYKLCSWKVTGKNYVNKCTYKNVLKNCFVNKEKPCNYIMFFMTGLDLFYFAIAYFILSKKAYILVKFWSYLRWRLITYKPLYGPLLVDVQTLQ